jgi:hypothetical protein
LLKTGFFRQVREPKIQRKNPGTLDVGRRISNRALLGIQVWAQL